MTLFEARARGRVKQWDLKQRTGISQTKISHIERGYIQPTDEEKKKIADALGVGVDEIEWSISSTIEA